MVEKWRQENEELWATEQWEQPLKVVEIVAENAA
jgi:hypothetical protein